MVETAPQVVQFENLVNYDKSKTCQGVMAGWELFENLVNYDKSKTVMPATVPLIAFENLVNYDKSKTIILIYFKKTSLRTL